MKPTLLSFLAVVFAAGPLWSAEPEYFRRNHGIHRDQSLPNNFSDDVRTQWRTALAPGHSTPCVYGDSIYLTTFDKTKGRLATVALDGKTGDVRWTKAVETSQLERVHAVGSPATCSVACNGERLFVFFGSYGLLCYELDGELVWERKMGPFQDEFGASSSPILVDGYVILNQDHDIDNFLIAIDQKTGDTVWKTKRDEFTRSYSTPIVWRDGDETQIVVAGSLQLAGYDLATGKKRWWVNSLSRIVDPTPVLANGLIYIATWTPGGDTSNRIAMEPYAEALASLDQNKDGKIGKSELRPGSPVAQRFFRIDLDQDEMLDKREWDRHASVFAAAQNVAIAVQSGGKGDVTKTHVKWVYRKGLPTVPSCVVYRDVLYMVKDSGVITSVDAKTGELLKQGRAKGRGNYYASLTAGDGKVYLASEQGVITILEAGRDWNVLASHDFQERIMATPVAVGGQFIVRTDAALYCFSKK